jgi:hypothetical protein
MERPAMDRARRIGLKVLYWLAVLALAIVILVVLIMLIESRDQSNVDHGGSGGDPAAHRA